MKKSIFNSIGLCALLILCGQLSFAKGVEKSKTFTETVDVPAIPSLITSTYSSDVEVKTWDKQKIAIKATLLIEARDAETVDHFLEKVEFELGVRGSQVTLSKPFNFSKKTKNFEISTDLFPMTKVAMEFDDGEVIKVFRYKISYQILVPENTIMKMKNYYGELSIADVKGDCDFQLYSCDFYGVDLKNIKMNSKYGDAIISSVADASFTLYEANLDLPNANSLDINTKYSKIKIGSFTDMKLIGYEDKLTLGKGNSLRGELKYASLVASELNSLRLSTYEIDAEIAKAGTVSLVSSKYSSYNIAMADDVGLAGSYEDKVNLGTCTNLEAVGKYTKLKVGSVSNSVILDGYENNLSVLKIDNDFEEIRITGKYLNIDLGFSAKSSFEFNGDIQYPNLSFDKARYKVVEQNKKGSRTQVKLYRGKTAGGDDASKVTVKGYEIKMKL